MTIRDIIHVLEQELPLWLQEEYDNCGLQVGSPDAEAQGALLAVDITEAVLEEARSLGCNLVVAHHPLLFKGLKRISESSYIERCVRFAIKHDIAVYAAHTNADNHASGLNYLLAQDLGLEHLTPLSPSSARLMRLTTYVPHAHLEEVQQALWQAGAGRIGSYDCCSFASQGVGSFRALDGARPFVGAMGELHREPETRLSCVFASADAPQIEAALLAAHPYEVPAYELIPLHNPLPGMGSGIIGDLPEAVPTRQMLERLEAYFETKQLRFSRSPLEQVRRVAICSGAGAFLWRAARSRGADLFITGEAKYNDYFDVEGKPILATVGHYESERIATRLFRQIISRKFANFALHESALDSNPITSL